jgi:hypothetical protein
MDRIVLNAYFSLGTTRARSWWRRLHDSSDELLDDTHLMRMAAGSPAGSRRGRGR